VIGRYEVLGQLATGGMVLGCISGPSGFRRPVVIKRVLPHLDDETGKPLGLVRRDISPQNVFVTHRGGVKLLDFGIARVADKSTRTATGHVNGKFQYMSREQCNGEPLDRRSDIFALGSVLHELTTSTKPFKRTKAPPRRVTPSATTAPVEEVSKW
jgi:serine/threonine protein kinase